MNWFLNLNIGTKLISSFVLMALVAIFIGYEGYTSLNQLSEDVTSMYNNDVAPLGDMVNIAAAFHQTRVNLRDLIRAGDAQTMEAKAARIRELNAIQGKAMELYGSTSMDETDRKEYEELVALDKRFDGVQERTIALAKENKDAEAWKFVDGEGAEIARAEQKIIETMTAANIESAKHSADVNREDAQASIRNMLMIAATGFFLALGLGILLSRIISRPLKRGVEMMQELSKGHLGMRLKMDTHDEVGLLAKTMDQFAEDLQNKVIMVMKQIAAGDVSAEVVAVDSGDEIAPALKKIIDTLRGLVAETAMLTKAALDGKLATRGNTEKFQGGYREIVAGVNATLDGVIGPLNVAAEYVDRISKGDIPPRITDTYNGDFNELKNNLNQCIDAVNALVKDAVMLSKAAVEGKLATRADATKHQGDFRKVVQGVDETLDAVIGPLNVAAEYVDRISKGDIPPRITDNYNGDFNELKNNLNQAIDAVTALVADAGMLSKAAVEGKLATRADATKHQGDFRKIVQGVDDTLDAVIGPLNVAAEYVDRISKGDIPPKITDNYNGDFNELKNNLNQCIDAVNALVKDAGMLSKAAVEGKLATRADATKHQGDFRKIVQGVNETIGSMVGFLDEVPTPVMVIDREFTIRYMNKTGARLGGREQSQIIGSRCYDFFKTGDCRTDNCACKKAMVSGEMSSSETDAHPNGMNLDVSYTGVAVKDENGAIIGALEVVSDLTAIRKAQRTADRISEFQNAEVQKVTTSLAQLAKGDLNFTTNVETGDDETKEAHEIFVTIANGLSQCKSAIETLVADAGMLSQAAVDGRLQTRADASKHQGDFKKIVDGVNATLDAVIKPVTEGVEALSKMSNGDMTIRITSEYKGDLALIKQSINGVGSSLDKALQDVLNAVDATASAASQISSSTEEMAAGAQEQTSQAGEVASAVEEMTKTIMENSKNASSAAGTAKKAKDSALAGGKVVDETVTGMRRIAEVVRKSADTVQELGRSSNQIGEIISVIDDIADQTNLLALNAAIEAARAGEQGRGFAVVADEVRKLAERTTKATKEIAGMIKKIQLDTAGAVSSMDQGTKEVDNGIKLADKAGDSLKEIVDVSQMVTDMVTQIAAASEEQSSASEQISKNVEAISAVTGETASGTQQVARAAEDLNRLTENLQQLITKFKLTSDGSSHGGKPERAKLAVRENGSLVRHI